MYMVKLGFINLCMNRVNFFTVSVSEKNVMYLTQGGKSRSKSKWSSSHQTQPIDDHHNGDDVFFLFIVALSSLPPSLLNDGSMANV